MPNDFTGKVAQTFLSVPGHPAKAHNTGKNPCAAFLALIFLSTLQVFNSSGFSQTRSGSDIFANTSVKNISIPFFNDTTGYREYLIQGERALYVSAVRIDIDKLAFTQFYGDGSTLAKSRITAPSATVHTGNKQALAISGTESIHLVYTNDLDATGENWDYDHGQKKLIINKNARIEYSAPLNNILGQISGTSATDGTAPEPQSQSPNSPKKNPNAPTLITSDALILSELDAVGSTLAIFNGNVAVTTTEGLSLLCDHLEVTAARLAEKNPALAPDDKFQLLVATGNVRLTQGARTITCGRAEILPKEDRIILTQTATVTDAALQITATGDPLTLHRNQRRIEGRNVRITLPNQKLQSKNWRAEGGMQPASNETTQFPAAVPSGPAIATSDNSALVVTARDYVMWKDMDDGDSTHATLDGAVTATDNDMRLTCEHLELSVKTDTARTRNSALETLVATQNVRLTQGVYEAVCNKAEVFPKEDRIVLTRDPVLLDHAASARATGNSFTISRADRRVTGDNIRITLPPLKDLSATAAKTSMAVASTTTPASAPAVGTSLEQETIITSLAFTMWQPVGDPLAHAKFDDNARVTATNLELTCDHLALDVDPVKSKSTQPATIKILGASPEVLKTPATDSVALSNEASFGVLNPKRINISTPAAPTPEQTIMAQLRYILATGRVHFTQLTREAICDKAEVVPPEDRITLTGKPMVTDRTRQIMATGDKLTLIRGQQDIQGENVRIVAPPMRAP